MVIITLFKGYVPLFLLFKKFKPAFDDALRRIYKLCCSGSDEIMTYGDLSKLQSRVFGSRLLSDEIDAIKDTLTKTVPDALAPDGITETGNILS